MKRWEGFKHTVSTPWAQLSTEIIILFEMKTVVIDNIFIWVYRYTGNRYIPSDNLIETATGNLQEIYIF